MTRIIAALIAIIALPALADAAPRKDVHRNIVKVVVEKILTVKLAPTQPADTKVRVVQMTIAATADKCADPAAEVFAFPEGDFEGFDYVGYWVAANGSCGTPTPVDVVHTMNLAVGKSHKFMLIGNKKWNQRISFRVDKDKISSLAIKKAMAR